MKFFQIDPALYNQILEGSEPIRIKLMLTTTTSEIIAIIHDSVETAFIYSSAEDSGVIRSTVDISFSRATKFLPGTEIMKAEIHLSCGDNSSSLHRFTMYPDDSNLKEEN